MPRTTALKEHESALIASIADRREALHDDLVRQVAIPTKTGHAEGIAAYRALMIDRLRGLGATIELRDGEPRPWWLASPVNRDASATAPEPTLVARGPVGANTPRVLITGHLDTVHEPDAILHEVVIGEEGVYANGPGVVDMKGGLVITIHALEVLKDAGVELNWTVLLNADEEKGSFESFDIISKVSAEHDLGIAVEPALADGSLAIERMGSGQFMIEVFGRSAHVGRAFDEGISAVTKLGELLVHVGAMADTARGRIINVGPLQGCPVTNAVPDYAACWGNMRFGDGETGEAIGRELDALATSGDAMPQVVVHRTINRPAKPKTPAVESFALSARQVAEDLGQSLPFATTGGVCDGNIMQAAGLPTIDTLGVRGGHLHRPDEFIELASLVERCQLLALLLLRVADGRVKPD